MFHNTTNERGKDLQKYSAKTASQAERILKFFKTYPGRSFTPEQVHDVLFDTKKVPLTSVRRSLSDLTNGTGKDKRDPDYVSPLVKTKTKRMGKFNRPIFTWKLR